jgi:signal peptidase I
MVELGLGLLVAALWTMTLRPASLGGPATYVVVRGDSMLPDFHSGDLVILRASETYGAGDVIGYRVPDGEVGAGHLVIHRVAAGDGHAGFTVAGDNNPAPDPWLPQSSDIVGKTWLVLPGLGRVISFLHQPAAAGALAVSLLVMLVISRGRGARGAATPGAATRRRRPANNPLGKLAT